VWIGGIAPASAEFVEGDFVSQIPWNIPPKTSSGLSRKPPRDGTQGVKFCREPFDAGLQLVRGHLPRSKNNIIRCLIAEAAARFPADLERISFKGAVDALRQYSAAIARVRNQKMRRQLWEDLLLNLV